MGKLIHLKDATDEKAPTTKVKLTKTVVAAAEWDPTGPAWQVLWDTEVQGFGLRLYQTKKSFIYLYRNHANKRRCLTIGSSTKYAAGAAREEAKQAEADVRKGLDPSAAKQEARKDPDEDTFGALARAYVDDYAKAKRKTWETDEKRLLPKNKPKAPVMRLHSLRPGHDSREAVEDALLRVHAEISASTPVEADRVIQTVNACLNWHIKRRNVSAAFTNIAELVDLNGWKPREGYIRPAELPGFALAVQALPLKWKGAIWLMLLTGSRSKSEALRLRWEDVHLHAGEFTYPETKNGKAHTLPMTPATRAIFEAMPRKGEWVFPGRSGPIQHARKTFAKVREGAKFVDEITPHTLRHTARTYLQTKLRVPGPTVDAVLNHSTHGMAGTYTHVHLDDVQAALAELETFILGEAKITDFAAYLATKPPKKKQKKGEK